MAKKDVYEFLTSLGLYTEQCDLIYGLLRTKKDVSNGILSFDIHIFIAKRVKALYDIKGKKK